jgi:hypothetical protein
VRAFRLTEKTGHLAAALFVDERTSLEGIDGGGRAIVLEAKEIPLQDRQRAGVVLAEGITRVVLLPRR